MLDGCFLVMVFGTRDGVLGADDNFTNQKYNARRGRIIRVWEGGLWGVCAWDWFWVLALEALHFRDLLVYKGTFRLGWAFLFACILIS